MYIHINNSLLPVTEVTSHIAQQHNTICNTIIERLQSDKTMCNKIIRRQSWLWIRFLCFTAFTIHLGSLVFMRIYPTNTQTSLGETKLDMIDFPVLFKVCFKPGFDIEKLKEAGYGSITNYFVGKSKYNRSVFGWAGHKEGGGVFDNVKGNLFTYMVQIKVNT